MLFKVLNQSAHYAGFNATLFCYGQTGSGKTWTMQGPSSNLPNNNQHRGLIQRTFEYILHQQSITCTNDIQYSNRVSSFVEIYNEQVFDLLDPSSPPCSIREDLKRGGTFVHGATNVVIESIADATTILETGTRNRTTAETLMNARSSRSHSILTLNIQTKTTNPITGITRVKEARINLVDLAGSERQKLSATVGQRLREGGHINKSLLTLGNCINALVDKSNGKMRHVHYRDSKLTLMLKDSLGGNAKSTLVANISASPHCILETISTLRFASRVKLVQNKAQVNQIMETTCVQSLHDEIKRLQAVVDGIDPMSSLSSSSSCNHPLLAENNHIFEADLLKYAQDVCASLQDQLSRAQKSIENYSSTFQFKEMQGHQARLLARFKDNEIVRLKLHIAKMDDDKGITNSASTSSKEQQTNMLQEIKELRTLIEKPSPDIMHHAALIIQLKAELKDIPATREYTNTLESQIKQAINLHKGWADKLILVTRDQESFCQRIYELESGKVVANLMGCVVEHERTIIELRDELQRFECAAEESLDERIALMADVEAFRDQVGLLEALVYERDQALLVSAVIEPGEAVVDDNIRQGDRLEIERLLCENGRLQGLVVDAGLDGSRPSSDTLALVNTELKSRIGGLEQQVLDLTLHVEQGNHALQSALAQKDLEREHSSTHAARDELARAQDLTETLLSRNELLKHECDTLSECIIELESRASKISTQLDLAVQDKRYLEVSLNSAIKSNSMNENAHIAVLNARICELRQSIDVTITKTAVATSEAACETDSISPTAYDILLTKLSKLDLVYDLLRAKHKDSTKELERIQSENKSLLQSNHKQKLQYKEDFNRVRTENSGLLRQIAGLSSHPYPANGAVTRRATRLLEQEQDKEN